MHADRLLIAPLTPLLLPLLYDETSRRHVVILDASLAIGAAMRGVG